MGSNVETKPEFRYEKLDEETRSFLNESRERISSLMKKTAQTIIELGDELNRVQERLGYGIFCEWIKAEFSWSYQTANRFQRVANEFGNLQISQIERIAPSALYELAYRSTPSSVREEALKLADEGTIVTHSLVKDLKSQAREKIEELPEKSEFEEAEEAGGAEEENGFSPPEDSLYSTPSTTAKVEETSIPPSKPLPASPWRNLSPTQRFYEGHPDDPAFKAELSEVEMVVAFPQSESELKKVFAANIPCQSFLLYFTKRLDDEVDRETIERSLRKILTQCLDAIEASTAENDTIVVQYLPVPALLAVFAKELKCQTVIVEPNPERAVEILKVWKQAKNA